MLVSSFNMVAIFWQTPNFTSKREPFGWRGGGDCWMPPPRPYIDFWRLKAYLELRDFNGNKEGGFWMLPFKTWISTLEVFNSLISFDQKNLEEFFDVLIILQSNSKMQLHFSCLMAGRQLHSKVHRWCHEKKVFF